MYSICELLKLHLLPIAIGLLLLVCGGIGLAYEHDFPSDYAV